MTVQKIRNNDPLAPTVDSSPALKRIFYQNLKIALALALLAFVYWTFGESITTGFGAAFAVFICVMIVLTLPRLLFWFLKLLATGAKDEHEKVHNYCHDNFIKS